MRQEAEAFEDGRQTVRSFDADDRLCCIETFAADGQLKAAIDYLYDDTGINMERVMRDSAGTVLRRIRLDKEGNELDTGDAGPVRWASMDGAEAGLDPKGKEQLGD
jgi:hypothetical protein